jgi:hypothetical protein
MPVVNLDLARAARKLGVIASIEGEPGDLWLVLRSRADNSVIAQARLQPGRMATSGKARQTGPECGRREAGSE